MTSVEGTLHRLFDLSLDVLFVIDDDGCVVLVSPSIERVLGYRPEELLGRRIVELVHPDDAERTTQLSTALLREGALDGFENRYRHTDGSYRWLLWTAQRSREDSCIYAAARDVTDRHAAEAELRATVDRLEEAQRVARLGSFEWDLEHRVASYTPEVERIFGRSLPVDVDSFLDVIHPDDRGRIEALMAEAVRSGGEAEADYRVPGPPERILHGRVEAVLGPDGRTRIMRGTVQDVTEARLEERRRRQSEQRLAEAERLAGMGSWEYDVDAETVLWSEGLYHLWARDRSAPPFHSEAFLERLRPDERERVERAIRDGVAREGRFEVDFEQPSESGPDRVMIVRGEAFERDGRAMLRGTVLDVTAQRRATMLQEQIGRLGRRALESGDIERLLDETCGVVARALGAGFAIVLAAHEDGTLRLAGASVLAGERGRLIVEAGSTSPALEALASGEPVVVPDWRAERRYAYTELMEGQGLRASVVVPIGGRERPFGVLSVNGPTPSEPDREDLTFLEAVASILATAIDRRRGEVAVEALADVRGRLVAETLEAEERTRRAISEQLHDGALQDLLAARQDLVEAAGDERDRAEMIGHAREGVERAVARLREAVQALHPVVLQHGGLEVALQAAAEQTARTGGFTARVAVDPEAAGVRDELLLSMARELLTNAAKHAGATTVDVAVRRDDGTLVLEVADDGRGADLEAVAAAPLRGHVGLASIAQRAEAVGGTFEVEAPPGGGTITRATLPAA